MSTEKHVTDVPLLLRAAEVSHLIGLGRSKVYELMATGELPTVHIGRSVRVPRVALENWVKRRTIVKPADADG